MSPPCDNSLTSFASTATSSQLLLPPSSSTLLTCSAPPSSASSPRSHTPTPTLLRSKLPRTPMPTSSTAVSPNLRTKAILSSSAQLINVALQLSALTPTSPRTRPLSSVPWPSPASSTPSSLLLSVVPGPLVVSSTSSVTLATRVPPAVSRTLSCVYMSCKANWFSAVALLPL